MSVHGLHFVLIHPGAAGNPGEPRMIHLGADRTSAPHPVHLLVLDARRMNRACVQASFAEIVRLRGVSGIRHGILVCERPDLPLVLGAMRAGLRDIVHEPLGAGQLLKLLKAANPDRGALARQMSAIAALVRMIAALERPAGAASLVRREHELTRRAEQVAHQETRLALEKAVLEDRERKLRASARRLEREFATRQNDSDLVPQEAPPAAAQTAPPFALDLQAIAIQLAERARALDARERMLRELEALLTAPRPHAGDRASAHPPLPARPVAATRPSGSPRRTLQPQP